MIKDYLNQPEEVAGIGYIYPISVLEWEQFSLLAQRFLMIGYDHIKYRLQLKEEIKLMDFLIALCLNSEDEAVRIKNLEDFKTLIEMTVRKSVRFMYDKVSKEWFFFLDEEGDEHQINRHNFDDYRKIVMRQNLLFEPLVAPNPMAQQVIDDAIMRMNKKGSPVDLESMIALVSVVRGLTPDLLAGYSYYQLRADFEVAQRIENNRIIHLYRCQGGKGNDIELVAPLSINENPYGFDKLFEKVDAEREQKLQKMLS